MNDSNATSGTRARPTERPPLRRPREGRMLAGVAAGIADHLGIDVAIVRLLIVVATVVTSGFGLLVYIAAIFVIPAADEQEERAAGAARAARTTSSDSGRDAAFWIGLALLVIGVLWVLSGIAGQVVLFPRSLFPGVYVRDLLWPLVLIGFGLALWKASDRRGAPPQFTPPQGTPPQGVQPQGTPPQGAPPQVVQPQGTVPSGTPSWQPPSPAAPPSDERSLGGDEPGTAARLGTGDEVTARIGTAGAVGTAASGASGPAGAPPTPVPGGPVERGWGEGYGQPGQGWQGPPPGAVGGGQPPGGHGAADAGGTWSPPERRRGSWLTRLTLGAALVTAGVMWLLQLAGAVPVGTSRIVAAVLLVIGIGLLIGTWFGRGRWLILAGGVLLPLVIVAELLRPFGVIDVPRENMRGTFGDVVTTPQDLTELEATYQIGAGSLVVDLTRLEFDEARDVDVRVGAGEVVVHLPQDITADVTTRIGAGEVWVDGRRSSGLGVPERTQRVEHGDGSELLTLDVSVGFGEARVDVVFDAEPALDELDLDAGAWTELDPVVLGPRTATTAD